MWRPPTRKAQPTREKSKSLLAHLLGLIFRGPLKSCPPAIPDAPVAYPADTHFARFAFDFPRVRRPNSITA
jgi:hypothetical protein